MQPALHGRQAHAQQLRCDVTRQFFKVAQGQNFAIFGGEPRKGGREAFMAFPADGQIFRIGPTPSGADPELVNRGSVQRLAGLPGARGEGGVARDRQQPRADTRLRAKLRTLPPRGEKRLLQHVLGVILRAREQPREAEHARLMPDDLGVKRLAVDQAFDFTGHVESPNKV